MAKITKETIMFEILTAYPGALKIFESHGMSCGNCMKVMKENLEAASRRHGTDLDRLLQQLNALEKGNST